MLNDARAVFRRQSGKVAAFLARQGERMGFDEHGCAGMRLVSLLQHEAEGFGIGLA